MAKDRSIWSYGLVKTFSDSGMQPTVDGDWSYGLLVERFEFESIAAVDGFVARYIDTHFIAEP